MKVFLILTCVFTVYSQEFKLAGLFFGCNFKDVTYEYHYSLQDFSTKLLKQVAKYNSHFVISQYSIWLALAAVSEGNVGETQKELFKTLNLPEDWCLREKYYEIATGLESPGLPVDVNISRKRFMVLNTDVKLNNTWRDMVGGAGLINSKKVDFKDTNSTENLKDLISAELDNVNITGNAIILDSLDYEGLWTTEFENSSIEQNADFFNDEGEKIGTVDLMKIKKRVKLAHIPILNAKLLELPVGNNQRYRMLFLLSIGKSSIRRTIEHFPSTLIMDSFPLLIESVIPLEIAIPKFTMTSELDLKKAIEDIGLDKIWNNFNVSRHISDPPALPSTLIQRATVKIEAAGLEKLEDPLLPNIADMATGLASAVGRSFIANRPFVYGLVDSQTRTWLFTCVFSQPNSNTVDSLS